MAARVIAQLIVNGAAIFSRAFYTAYQQAIKNAKSGGAAQAAAKANKLKMRPDEALKILNFEKHELNKKTLVERYNKLFELNDPAKGGSFYLQSKIYRSKEVLDRVLEEEEEAKSPKSDTSADSSTDQTESKPPDQKC